MVFFLLMQFVWKYVDDLVGKGIEWYYIIELMIYISATVVPLALPLAVLLSSLMTFGSFGEHNELAAMRSSGISLIRLFRVLIVFVAMLSIGAFFFADRVIPVAQFKGKSLLRNITKKKPALNIRPGIFYKGIEGYSLKISEKAGPERNELKNIIIYDHTAKLGNVKVTTAETGIMEVTPDNRYMIIYLDRGQTYEEHMPSNRADRDKKPFSSSEFERAVVRFPLDDFQSGDMRKETSKDFNMLNNSQLVLAVDSLNLILTEARGNFARSMRERFSPFSDDTVRMTSPDTLDPPVYDILENFDPFRQKLVVENALRLARSNRSFFDSKHTELHWRERTVARHKIEWHKKYSLSFVCFVLLFIGAPLGAIIRKGGMGMPVVISVFIFITFYVLSISFEKMGREIIWHAWASMWVTPLCFLPIGLLLTYKTANDAEFMGVEFWSKIFRKILSPFRRKKVASQSQTTPDEDSSSSQ